MKKVLLLVMAAVLMILCTACAKNEPKKDLYNVTIYNRMGADMTDISIKDNKTGDSIKVDKIANGSKGGFGFNAVVGSNGLPDLSFTYTDGNGNQTTQTLALTSKTAEMTMTPDGLEYTAPKE